MPTMVKIQGKWSEHKVYVSELVLHRLLRPVQWTAYQEVHGGHESVHSGLQRTKCHRGQNKPHSAPWQVSGWIKTLRWTKSANGPWKNFPNLGAIKSTALQNYQNHLSHTLRTCFTLRTLGCHQWPFPIPRYWWEWLSPLLSLLPRHQKKKGDWKWLSHPLSPFLDPPYPNCGPNEQASLSTM